MGGEVYAAPAVPCDAAHFAGREGHLMCLQTLVLAHDSVQAVLEVRNDEVGPTALCCIAELRAFLHASLKRGTTSHEK